MKTKTAWGIDIGTTALKAMRLEPAPDGLAVYMTSCHWHRMKECDEQMSDGSWPSVRFHVAYGLGLQALGEARMQTNLLGHKKRQPFSWNTFFAPLRRLIPRVKISWDR